MRWLAECMQCRRWNRQLVIVVVVLCVYLTASSLYGGSSSSRGQETRQVGAECPKGMCYMKSLEMGQIRCYVITCRQSTAASPSETHSTGSTSGEQCRASVLDHAFESFIDLLIDDHWLTTSICRQDSEQTEEAARSAATRDACKEGGSRDPRFCCGSPQSIGA